MVLGSIFKSGSEIRLDVQVLDVVSGRVLSAESVRGDDVFPLVDELTDRIVATVADPFGVLVRSLGALAMAKPIEGLNAYDCVDRHFVYYQSVGPAKHAQVRTAVEQALEREPNHANGWACLSTLYLDEFRNDYNIRPDSLDRSLKASRRAVEE